MIKIIEDKSSSYSPRTYANAKSAQLTVAFAEDFTTAGEKCTHKAAGDAYVSIALMEAPIIAARALYKALRDKDVKVLNVAGNGIYTLNKFGWTQEKLNAHIFQILSKVTEHWKLDKVVSGGQTGVDMAGVIAAHALGIDAQALLPKGFIQRGTDKQDVPKSEQLIMYQVIEGVAKINEQKDVLLSSLDVPPSRKESSENQGKFTFFFSPSSPFSNWNKTKFFVDNHEFFCNEQYMMWRKAMLFSDGATASKILSAQSQSECKALGRQVANFDNSIWIDHRENIVLDGARAQFKQNPHKKEALLKTAGTILVEASPYDDIWGIKMGVGHPDIMDPTKWKGLNLLGKVLTQLRDEFLLELKSGPAKSNRMS